jgi:phosphohistidine phosphatase
MKTVYVMRHSKADQNFMGSDFERKLTDQGKLNTNIVALRFLEKNLHTDMVISSPAKRAEKTAQLFAETIGISKDKILYKSELYHAPEEVYLKLINALPNTIETAVFVAHNPGITNFINNLGIVQLDNMPTSGIFGFKVQSKDWADFEKAEKVFLYFDYPKK